MSETTHTPPRTGLVGVDWGTTHRRAYALDDQGACTDTLADDLGALPCQGRFAPALASALQQLKAQPRQVVLSGMVGSALGWHEAPYLDASVPLTDLPRHLVTVHDADTGVPTGIVPGYCVRDSHGQPDVMRGEETQLLGAVALGHHSGWFVLPGTHSKWVKLEQGRIVHLRTHMTGELFDLLGQHGTLAAAAKQAEPVWSDDAFAAGVQAARHGPLGHQLFGCRARVVCGDMPAAHSRSYLSGLLIGAELADVLSPTVDQCLGRAFADGFKLIGSPALATRYQAAAAVLGFAFAPIDAQAAYLGALAHFQQAGRLS
ncbi:MAG TPA: 2-dehydro-3-deoxygalactonokinase [Burkholderiaceae bacterium]|nr:2-dehydro-3-deoxygalactonokinase [Burkholderiaceae bacterium]